MKSTYHLVLIALITSTVINAAPKRVPNISDERDNLGKFIGVSPAIAIAATGGYSPSLSNHRNITISPSLPVSNETTSPQQRTQSALTLPTMNGFLSPDSPIACAKTLDDELPKFSKGFLAKHKQDNNDNH
jgi:hypothetical protein